MNARQSAVLNHVLLSTSLLKDLCRVVAEYAYPGRFKYQLKKTINLKLHDSSQVWHIIQQNGRDTLILFKADMDLISGEMTRTKRPVSFNGIRGGWMNGKRWICLFGSVWCDRNMIARLVDCRVANPAKWLGCDEDLQEVYFITEAGLIHTLNEKGDPLPSYPVSTLLVQYLYENLSRCVIKNRKFVMWVWVDSLQSSKLLTIKLEDLWKLFSFTQEGMSVITVVCNGFRDHLCIFSGDSEDEIFSVNLHEGRALIYSFETMRLLREEKIPKHYFVASLVQIQNTLYCVTERENELEISVFE
jgi:hypothetical protein